MFLLFLIHPIVWFLMSNSVAPDDHSQNGEEEFLAATFAKLGIAQGTFCEFGAWDGQHLSNCYGFYQKGWGGWYIEGDRKRFGDLQRNITEKRVETICSFVQPSGPDCLDQILSRSKLYASGVTTIDLLSIDIDSDDLAVWRGVKVFRPKIVIIEFNPTIPIDTYFENTPGKNHGNSPLSIYEHARSIEYDLIAIIGANLIFVDHRLGTGLPVIPLTGAASGMRYFFGIDGTMFVTKPGAGAVAKSPDMIRVPWIGGVFPQPVDAPFRRFDPGKFSSTVQRFWSYLKMIFTNPISIVKRLFR